jgi:Fur family transcriptional regulator, iron response regulator
MRPLPELLDLDRVHMSETSASAPEIAALDSIEPEAWPPMDCACARNDHAAPREIEAMLIGAGLRPTRQRLMLARLLFGQGDRHLTAEMLHSEAERSGQKVSLATVYNTLNIFAKNGMLRELGVDGSTTYFDTRTGDHHHFFIEDAAEIRDIPMTQIRIGKMASVPEGYEISRVDLVIRLRKR